VGAETLAAPAAFDPIILRTLDDLRLTDLLLWRTLGIWTSARWRRDNPGYGKNDYPRVKAYLEKNPGYLQRYRQSHPEYVQKNRDAQKCRDRAKRIHLDIQAKLSRQPSEIVAQSKSIPKVSHLDIQDEFIMKPIEITLFLSRFVHFSHLDIQAEMDFSVSLPDNGIIKHGGGAYGCKMAHRS